MPNTMLMLAHTETMAHWWHGHFGELHLNFYNRPAIEITC